MPANGGKGQAERSSCRDAAGGARATPFGSFAVFATPDREPAPPPPLPPPRIPPVDWREEMAERQRLEREEREREARENAEPIDEPAESLRAIPAKRQKKGSTPLLDQVRIWMRSEG